MPDESESWGLVQSFFIDTDGYTDRDREMFVCGVEFQMICQSLDDGWVGFRLFHTENESRVRMLCGQRGVPFNIRSLSEGWSELLVDAPRRKE